MPSFRTLAAVLGAVALAGCNAVVTKTPLLTRADEAGAPSAKPGLWRFAGDTDCQVDEAKPLADWPECGGGVVLKDGKAGYYERKTGKPVWTLQPVILAAGAPRIAQVQVVVGGDVTVESNPFAYAGARATQSDAQGRITAFAFWPVQCGPPPKGADADPITTAPLPGLVLKPGEPACTTASVAALRNAAKLSEAWAPKPMTARWLRDGP